MHYTFCLVYYQYKIYFCKMIIIKKKKNNKTLTKMPILFFTCIFFLRRFLNPEYQQGCSQCEIPLPKLSAA